MRHGQVRQLHGLLSRLEIGILKAVEVLQQADQSVAGFSKGILLWKVLLASGHS